MSKVVGIDLGTTNSPRRLRQGRRARSSSAIAAATALVPSVVSVGAGRHDLRRPRGAAAAADRRAAHRVFREALHGQGRATTSATRRAFSVPCRAAKRRRGAHRPRRPRVHAAGDLGVHPARAEAPRRGVLRRAGRVRQRSRPRRHHRPGVLQRRAAHRDARRRPHRRPRGAAHHQRADRGVARLRARQAARRAHRRVRPRRRHVRHLDPARRGRRVPGALDQRRHASRRRRHRPAADAPRARPGSAGPQSAERIQEIRKAVIQAKWDLSERDETTELQRRAASRATSSTR